MNHNKKESVLNIIICYWTSSNMHASWSWHCAVQSIVLVAVLYVRKYMKISFKWTHDSCIHGTDFTGTVNIMMALSVVVCMIGGSCHKSKFVALVSAFPHQCQLCRNNVSLDTLMSALQHQCQLFRTNVHFAAPNVWPTCVKWRDTHSQGLDRFNLYCTKSTNVTNATFSFRQWL